jgi:hypothetical protein
LEQEKEQFEVGVENRFIYEEGAEDIGRGGNCFAKQTGEGGIGYWWNRNWVNGIGGLGHNLDTVETGLEFLEKNWNEWRRI